ncbi:coiled-coil domain-containing protein 77 [Rhizophagus clarus]|uniref:Coiled-coil domain-containing protein 77 n=1 Tax=Rhizophagus clarus TaxID=94130 RepID=A0A8H3KX47_9GLOM|nr:coiled-coil domain-containing protein 77 [Rhizophagus clarus]
MLDPKIEIKKLPLSENLLRYYQERCETAEQEYKDAIDAIDKCKIAHEEHHKLVWDLQQRLQEIADLQKDLSDTQLFLTEERKRFMKVVAENDELRVQELQDRRKIQYLLSITGPLNQDDHSISSKESQGSRVKDPRDNEIESLKLMVKSLQSQLEEQVWELTNKIQRMENVFRENIKEILQLKKDKMTEERRINEELASLLQEFGDLKVKYREEKEKNDAIELGIESKIATKYDSLISELKRQNDQYEGELKSIKFEKEQYEESSNRKIQILQKKVDSLTNNYNNMKKRRDYDFEGFSNDIVMLRKKLKGLEKQILKYAPYDDHEYHLTNIVNETERQIDKVSNELRMLKAPFRERELFLDNIL